MKKLILATNNRHKVAEITEVPVEEAEKGKLVVEVEDTLVGTLRRIPLDMVVLCTGLEAHESLPDIAGLCSVSIGKDGFVIEKHPKLGPVATATDGVTKEGVSTIDYEIAFLQMRQ